MVHVDPLSEIGLRMNYKQCVGEKLFAEMHSKIFDSALSTAELVVGTEHGLVSSNKSGTMMLFRLRDRKFFIESIETAKQQRDAQDLRTLVDAYGEGKLELE